MPSKKKPEPVEAEDKSLLDPLRWVRDTHKKVEELLMLTQKLTDAVAHLTLAVGAADKKIDDLIASQATLATPAEQDAVANQIEAYSATLDAAAQKS